MLDKKVFAQAMAGMGSVWKEIQAVANDEFASALWYRTLADLDDDSFKDGVVHIMKTFHFAPKPADIREAALVSTKPLLGAEEAWNLVVNDVRRGNFYFGIPKYQDWKINKTLESFASLELRDMTSENRPILRAQFLKIYNQYRDREREALVTNDPKLKALLQSIGGLPQLEG
ncbi:MAG: hypothetical protein GX457_18025 [Thermotogaceae bacterium]|nr:hypothetical protein [Thermotogaceae bacterium]